jgi:hypothetical protein
MSLAARVLLRHRSSSRRWLTNRVLRREYSFGIPGLECIDMSRDVEHTALFCKEVLHYLAPAPGKTYLDLTFGSGGHTQLLLNHCPQCKVISSDADRLSYHAAMELSHR